MSESTQTTQQTTPAPATQAPAAPPAAPAPVAPAGAAAPAVDPELKKAAARLERIEPIFRAQLDAQKARLPQEVREQIDRLGLPLDQQWETVVRFVNALHVTPPLAAPPTAPAPAPEAGGPVTAQPPTMPAPVIPIAAVAPPPHPIPPPMVAVDGYEKELEALRQAGQLNSRTQHALLKKYRTASR